jgi:mono/diheme cytochrome c family protein
VRAEDPRMKPPVIIAGIVTMLAVIVGGVVMMLSQGGGSAAYATMTGKELYGKLCMQCHGDRGTAIKGAGNSYRGKRQLWTETTLLAYIAQPAQVKAKTPHLRGSNKYMPGISPAVPFGARKKLVAHVISLMDALEPDVPVTTKPSAAADSQ